MCASLMDPHDGMVYPVNEKDACESPRGSPARPFFFEQQGFQEPLEPSGLEETARASWLGGYSVCTQIQQNPWYPLGYL